MKKFLNVTNPFFITLIIVITLSIVPATHFVQEKVENATYSFVVNVQEKTSNILNIANAKAGFNYL